MEKLKIILGDKKNLLIILLVFVAILLFGISFYMSFGSFISEKEAKEIFYKEINVTKKYLKIKKIKLHKFRKRYNIDFTYTRIKDEKFTLILNAVDGKVIKNTFNEYGAKHSSDPKYVFDYIDENAAKNLIANDLNTQVENIKFTKFKFTKKRASAIYDAKVEYADFVATYKIDAISGKILDGYTLIERKKK